MTKRSTCQIVVAQDRSVLLPSENQFIVTEDRWTCSTTWNRIFLHEEREQCVESVPIRKKILLVDWKSVWEFVSIVIEEDSDRNLCSVQWCNHRTSLVIREDPTYEDFRKEDSYRRRERRSFRWACGEKLYFSLFKSIATKSFSRRTTTAEGSGTSNEQRRGRWWWLPRAHVPAIWGDGVMIWKSMIELSIWRTLVVWPRRIVRK